MAQPVMSMVHETPKEAGRLMAFVVNGETGYYLIPDDGRAYDEYLVSELRPFPAFDAMDQLGRIFGGWSPLSMWNVANDRARFLGYPDNTPDTD